MLAASTPVWVNALFVIGFLVQVVVLYRLSRRRVARGWFTVGLVATATLGIVSLIAGAVATSPGLVICGLFFLVVAVYGWVNRLEKVQP